MRISFKAWLLTITMSPLAAAGQTRLRVMEWNVENLFDVSHDSLKDDHEFLPEAERRWTGWRYWTKLNDVAKTILAASTERLPDMVGLCEVENDSVMHSLTKRSALRGAGYEYVMTDSPDRRGIDCALLYQPFAFGIIESRGIRIPSEAEGFAPTRDILYVKGEAGTSDTLHVLVCHMPSQTGGHRQSDKHRRLAMATLQAVVDSLEGKNVIVMGDFNTDRPRLASMTRIQPQFHKGDSVHGTYRFQGDWSCLDHIFISGSAHCDNSKICQWPFLLEENRTFGGVMPRRTFRGPSYHGGISDHLPIVADITLPHKAAK